MFFIAYPFKAQVHVFGTSENCKSLVLQDKYNIEIFCPLLTSVDYISFSDLFPAYLNTFLLSLDKVEGFSFGVVHPFHQE